jgi:hypothetical protein
MRREQLVCAEELKITLKQAYKDFLKLMAFLGLTAVSIFAVYGYFTIHDTGLLVFAVLVMALVVLMGIARALFTIEFWRAIFENWRKH